jgi:hypothetical protein
MNINIGCIEITDSMSDKRELELAVRIDSTSYKYEYINEADALLLICHLIKVFQVPKSNIEVMHFPTGSDRAAVLRKAADILDQEKTLLVSPFPAAPSATDMKAIFSQLDVLVKEEGITPEEAFDSVFGSTCTDGEVS